MADQSDPLLLTKKASKLVKGQPSGIPGVVTISRGFVKWGPDDPSQAQKVAIEILKITSRSQCLLCVSTLHLIYELFAERQQVAGKPYLRLLAICSEPLGLSFSTESDRNEVLDLLNQLFSGISQSTSTPPGIGSLTGGIIPSEDQRQRLFRQVADLEILYGQLVKGGILSEEDFWQARQDIVKKLTTHGDNGDWKQRHGLPSALPEIRPIADGQTEKVTFKLTRELIQQIFAERPEVHRAYLANVPHSMDDAQFWETYCKWELKRDARRRKAAAAGMLSSSASIEGDIEEDTLFAPHRKAMAENEAARRKGKAKMVDPTVNLVADVSDRTLGDMVRSAEIVGRDSDEQGGESLANEMNRHAALVLQGAPVGFGDDFVDRKGRSESTTAIASRVAASIAAAQAAEAKLAKSIGTAMHADEETVQKWRERAVSSLEDLVLMDREDIEIRNGASAKDIRDPRLQFQKSLEAGVGVLPKLPVTDTLEEVLSALQSIDPNHLPLCDPDAAEGALLELGHNEDEALIEEFGPVAINALIQGPREALGSVMIDFFRAEALKTNELLRHLWSCMPVGGNAAKKEKGRRLSAAAREQKKSMAAQMLAGAGTEQQVLIVQMLRPLSIALDASLEFWEANNT